MGKIVDIPRIDVRPEGDFQPRQVTFQVPPVARRNFLRTIVVGAMALGVTGLSLIPLGRKASAAGTEYTDCAGYGNGDWPGYVNNTRRCVGAPYSTTYCQGGWFKDGCFRAPDNYVDCYRPIRICGDDGREPRNAWRWTHNGTLWRCADGEYKCQPCGSWELRICSANLS